MEEKWLTCHAVDGPPSKTGPPGPNITAIRGPPLLWMVPPLAWYLANV